jgi:hypothetical protein
MGDDAPSKLLQLSVGLSGSMRASVIMENAYALAQHPPSPVLNYNLMT